MNEREILDSLPTLVAYCDAEQRYEFVNLAYADVVGRAFDQIVGRRVAEVVPDAVYSQIRPRIEAALRGDEQSFDMQMPLGTGGRWMRTRYVPHYAGTVVDGFCVVLIDVTERKRTEEELLAVYESTPHGMCFMDDDLRYRRINQKLCDMNGLTADQHLGRTLRSRRALESRLAGSARPMYLEEGGATEAEWFFARMEPCW